MSNTRQLLVSCLERDFRDNTVPLGPKGVKQAPYAEELGITKSALSFHKDVFVEYNKRLPPRVPRAISLIPAIRSLFKTLLDSGELQVLDRKASRSQLLEPFGLTGGSYRSRHPQLRKMLEEFDHAIVTSNYVPKSLRSVLERVRELVFSGDYDDPVTGKVNRTRLNLALGIDDSHISPPFLQVIEEYESSQRARLEVDPLSFVASGRTYSFRDLLPLGFDEDRLARTVECFRAAFENNNRRELSRKFNDIHRLLSFMGSGQAWGCRTMMSALSNPQSASFRADSFRLFLRQYEAGILSEMTPATADGVVIRTNAVLRALARKNIVPHLPWLLQKKRHQHTPRKSVAQLYVDEKSDDGMSSKSVEDALRFASEVLEMDEAEVRTYLELTDTESFLLSLKQELRRLPHGFNGNILNGISIVLNTRLEKLYEHFSELFDRWSRHYEEGKVLIRDAVDPDRYWSEAFAGGRAPNLREFFPEPFKNRRRGLCNLLRLVRDKFGGRIPGKDYPDKKVYRFFRRRLFEYGGRPLIAAYLHPHKDLVASIVALYLVESGANVAVARTLGPDAIQESDEPGFGVVFGRKVRARGKPIVIFLELTRSAMRALLWWRNEFSDTAAKLRRVSDGLLFSAEIGGRIQEISETWFGEWFSNQVATIGFFNGLRLTPSMLRPSILLLSVLDHNGRLRHAIALAQHTEGSFGSYYKRFPTRFMHDAEIRGYTRILESIAIHRIEGGQAYLGLTDVEMAERLNEFIPTGLGTKCRNPYDHPIGNGQKCSALNCWDCPNAIVVVEPDSLGSLIVWRRSLEEVEGDWIREQPDRWEKHFLPWLCFTQVVEEVVQGRAELFDIWELATTRADEIMAAPGYSPYKPWS